MIDGQNVAPSERVLDLIKKLNAKAESASKIGSSAEAEAFAAKVTQMLLDYNLSMDEISLEGQTVEPIDREIFRPELFGVTAKKSRILWQEILAIAVAQANFCRILVHPGRNSLSFVGRRHNREVAMWLYGSLVADLEEVATKEYVRYFYQCRDNGDVTVARGYRASWLTGAVTAVQRRLLADREKALEEPKVSALMSRTAIELSEFVDKFEPAAPVSGRQTTNRDGVKDGLAYGNAVGLDSAAIRAQKRGQRALASPAQPESERNADAKLASIYIKALVAAGLAETSRREGVAFNLRAKGFSVATAIEVATRRLGTRPTQYTVFGGTIYLSDSGEISSNPWIRVQTTADTED